MYLSHFGLKIQPFGVAPDPEFFWPGPHLEEALQRLEQAARRPKPCLLVTGDVGTGKTILVKRLMAALGGFGVTLTIGDPDLGAGGIFGMLALELGMETFRPGRAGFCEDLRQFLPRAFPERPDLWLVIEEAQQLTPQALREAAELSEFQLEDRHGFGIVLVGAPEMNERLALPENEEFRRRIGGQCHLEPLPAAAVQGYIAHRLGLAGAGRPLFTAEAVEAVFALSGGVPRLINMLCDHALLYGYGSHLEVITDTVVRDCSRDLGVALDKDGVPEIEYKPGMVAELGAGAPESGGKMPAHDLRRILLITGAVCLVGIILLVLIGK
jgi:general secretion pathway protein A